MEIQFTYKNLLVDTGYQLFSIIDVKIITKNQEKLTLAVGLPGGQISWEFTNLEDLNKNYDFLTNIQKKYFSERIEVAERQLNSSSAMVALQAKMTEHVIK